MPIKPFKYKRENINTHNATGDVVRLFLIYRELFIHQKNNPFKIKYFSNRDF